VEEIEPATGEPEQLAATKAGERRHQHQSAIAGLDGLGQLPDLGDRDDLALRRPFDASTRNHAGVLDDQLVGRCCGQVV